MHIDNKNKVILILCKRPTRGSDNTTLTAEAGYAINFSRSQKKDCLSIHYNGNKNISIQSKKTLKLNHIHCV